MSNWERLRETHAGFGGGKKINQDVAKRHDSNTKEAQQLVFDNLKELFPTDCIRLIRELKKSEINQKLHDFNPQFGTFQFNPNSSIRPDGGIIEIKDDDGNWRVVLVSEAKRQGTNIHRLMEGKEKQSSGNAIERMYKNIQEMKNYMISESYFPYLIFAFGADFTLESLVIDVNGTQVSFEPTSIPDRTTAATLGQELNTNYIRCVGTEKITSVHMRLEPWSRGEMFERMWDAALESITIINEQYGVTVDQ